VRGELEFAFFPFSCSFLFLLLSIPFCVFGISFAHDNNLKFLEQNKFYWFKDEWDGLTWASQSMSS
jgi:hypothetical protein